MNSQDYFFHNNSEIVTSVFLKIVQDDTSGGALDFLGSDVIFEFFKGLGRLFYVVNPSESTFKDSKDVPKYFAEAWPYFLLFMFLENLILRFQDQPTYRLNDSLTSLSHGIIQHAGKLIFRSAESWAYVYIYNNFRLFEMQWNNPVVWYLAAIGVDFCYYWAHRACHEIHVLWAQHQVHHSSEEFNLAVGLRQSILQGWCGFIFYLPIAFFIPPAHFITHQQFNLLYQFWIHTQTVKTIGPLEYIFNTPQHHRVHHGSNIYCLDKNYGGVLIIWDRLFGTFASEKEDEEIIYGLVFNQPSFNPLHLQTFYSDYVVQKFNSMVGWRHKIAAVFYGPSWQPGKPRLGDEKDKVKVTKRDKYDVKLPFWCNIYLLIHFCVIVYGYHQLAAHHMGMTPISVFFFVVYIISSLTTIGMVFDNSPYAPVFELLRCMILVTIIQRTNFIAVKDSLLVGSEVFFVISGLFWFLQCTKVIQIGKSTKLH